MSTMEYVKLGNGPRTFVLIAGIGLDSVLPKAEAVRGLYARFLNDYTLYLFDRSMEISTDVKVPDFARDTVACLKEAGVNSAIFTGMSHGGMIAQQIAIDYPDMVSKLIICSSSCCPNETSRATVTHWRDLAEKCDVPALNRSFVDLVYSEETKAQFGDFFKMQENVGTPEQCRRFVALLDSCAGFDCREQLGNIQCPVLVLGSRKDRALGAEGSLTISETLGCTCYMYEGYSHAVYDEAKDFLDHIEAFVR